MAGGLLPSRPICNRKIRGGWKGLASLLYAKSKGICTGLGEFLRTSLKYIIALSADTVRTVLSRPHRWGKRVLGKLLRNLFYKVHSEHSHCGNPLNYFQWRETSNHSYQLKATEVQWKLTQEKIVAQTILWHRRPLPQVCECFTKILGPGTYAPGLDLERQQKTFQGASHTAIVVGPTKNGINLDTERATQYAVAKKRPASYLQLQ